MDENVVFKPVEQSATQETPAAQSQGASVTATDQQTVQQDAQQTQQPAAPVVSPPAGNNGSFFKRNWKKFLIVLLLFIFLLVIISVLMPKSTKVEQVKLIWWGLWEETPAMQTLILDFKKTNPNIDIEYIKRTPEDYRDRLLSRMDNNSGPDIFRYHNSWVPMLGDKLLPLSVDVITPEDFKNAYYPVIQKDLMKNNGIVGIPLGVDSLAMFVNTELFADAGVQVPKNWDDFRTVSKDLTVKDKATGKIKQAGAALGTFGNVKHASDIISLLYVQQGVNMYTFAGDAKSKTDALDFYSSFAKGDNSVWDPTLDNSLLAFSKGTLAIYFGYSWDVFQIQKLNKDLKFKIYTVPSLAKSTTIASYWVEGVSSKSKHQKEAFQFMKYLSQKETAQKLYTESAKTRLFGEPYARKDLRESLHEEPLVYPFISQLDDASSTIFSSDTRDGETGMNSALNKYLEDAVNSIIIDNNSADSATETLDQGVAQILEKYGVSQTKQE